MTTTGAMGMAARRPARGVLGLLERALERAWVWDFRMRTRHRLAQLDDHLLRDIGLDPLAAETEIRKPFWKA